MYTADFVLLMCASQQWKVFKNERTEDWMVLAGENTDCPDPMENQLFNPTPNFINCRQKASFIEPLTLTSVQLSNIQINALVLLFILLIVLVHSVVEEVGGEERPDFGSYL